MPWTQFVKPEKNGYINENSPRRDFTFEFDGRNKLVKVSGETFPVKIGEFLFIKLDNNWNPDIRVGIKAIDSLSISTKTHYEILKHISQ